MSVLSLKDAFAKQKLSFIFYLFCLFFSPPVIPKVNIIIFVFIYSLIMLFTKYRNNIKRIISYATIDKFLLGFVFFIYYLLVITLLNVFLGNSVTINDYILIIYRFFLIVPVLIVCIIYVIARCDELNYDVKDFFLAIILAAFVQGILTILSFIFPGVRNLFIQIMKENTGTGVFNKRWEVNQRFFGFANDMLDGFGYGVGILASLPFTICLYNRKFSYLIFLPILFLIPLLNVRTGLVIFLLGVICSLPLIVGADKKFKKRLSIIILLILFIMIIGIASIYIIYPATIEWVTRDFVAIFRFIFFDENAPIGTNSVASWFSGSHFTFPSFPEIIFGTGHVIYSTKGFRNSDVGYINDLWLCGIVGSFILYTVLFSLFYRLWSVDKDKLVKVLSVFFLLSFLIFQLKGRAFMANLGTILSLLICFYLIYFYNSKRVKENLKTCKNRRYIEKIKRDDLNDVISIVVPIYKVEKYLEKCIDSIINQDYKNLEIILVDDGSPDRCPQTCDEYANKDERIKVIHKENGGLSDARNAGIKVATGKYIAFIDSDDYVTENYISTLLYTIKKYDADISACNYIKLYEDSGIEKVKPKTNEDLVMTNIEAMKDLFTLPNNSDVVAWNKLYKTSLFTQNNIEFPKGKLHEDNFTTYKLYYYSNKVVFTNVPCYYYLQRKDSIMGKKFNIKRLDILLACYQQIDFIHKNNLNLHDEVLFNSFLIHLYILDLLLRATNVNKKILINVSDYIVSNEKEFINNKYISKKHRLRIYALKKGIWCYKLYDNFCKFAKIILGGGSDFSR